MITVFHLPDDAIEFISFAKKCYEIGTPSKFDLIVGAFQKLRSLVVKDILLSEISLMHNFDYESPGWDTNQVLLYVDKKFSLGISILHTSPENLLNSVADSAYLVLGSTPFRYTLHKIDPHLNREVFTPDIDIVSSTEHVLLPGEVLRIHAGIDLIDWHVEEPVTLLRFISAPQEYLQWTFQRNPLRPLFVASVDPAATQLSALCAFFAASKYPAAAKPMQKLSQHNNHQVRWEAVQSLWQIEPELGYESLILSLDDRHPHVRNAALKSMEKLKNHRGLK